LQSRAIAVKTARCRCQHRYVSKFPAASCCSPCDRMAFFSFLFMARCYAERHYSNQSSPLSKPCFMITVLCQSSLHYFPNSHNLHTPLANLSLTTVTQFSILNHLQLIQNSIIHAVIRS